MKRTRISLALLLPVCSLAILWGCGGGSSPSSGSDRSAGSLQFTIKWPEPSRLIPVASSSIHIVLTAGDQTVGDKLVPRPPAGTNTSTVTFNGLKPGAVTVVATAFPQPNGTGTAQATGTVGVTIVADQTVSQTLTMASTIDHVAITPARAALVQGKPMTLSATAYNAAGDVVLTTGSTWNWSTSSSSVATVAPNGAQAVVTGVLQNPVTITARETESGKSDQLATTPLSRFIITDLNVVSGETSSKAFAINASGQVVGVSGASGFLWTNGTLTPISLATYTISANSINTAGVVAGTGTQRAIDHAFAWANGSFSSIESMLQLSSPTEANGINDSGLVAGVSQHVTANQSLVGQAALFNTNARTFTALGALVTDGISRALGVNSLGQVVGDSVAPSTTFAEHAFLWQSGVMTDLGTFGGTYSTAYAINAAGMIVGSASLPGDSDSHAFRTQPNAVLSQSTDDLGVLSGDTDSEAFAINGAGDVVGDSSQTVSDVRISRAFLWTSGSMLDLVTQIPLDAGWALQEAHGINDGGQIVGFGVNPAGATHAFLLTPR